MKILLIGYGKMGKAIEAVALQRGHEIVGRIDVHNSDELAQFNGKNVDVAIEFTHPDAAYANVVYCIENYIPVVCGTTGWLSKMDAVKALCNEKNGSFCYASNFSIGVNIFFKINEILARYMNAHSGYDVTMSETHHVYKKDAPSGTAITLAEGILRNLDRKNKWNIALEQNTPDTLYIEHKRIHNEPGIHEVQYRSAEDAITLTHHAFNRQGFATGAVVAAEFIQHKKGIFNMQDVLSLD